MMRPTLQHMDQQLDSGTGTGSGSESIWPWNGRVLEESGRVLALGQLLELAEVLLGTDRVSD